MGNLKKTINSGSNRVVRMTISKNYGTALKKNVRFQQAPAWAQSQFTLLEQPALLFFHGAQQHATSQSSFS